MSTSSIPKASAAGLVLAGVTMALGVYFGTKVADQNVGLFLLRLFYALAAAAVLKSVFLWGEARGFPIRRHDGRLHGAHLIRNLVMAAITVPVVLIVAAPLVLLAFELAR